MTRSPAIIRAGDVVELSTGVSVLSGAEIREAAYGAQLPVRQPPRSGNSCPTAAVRSTRRERLSRVDSGRSSRRARTTGMRRRSG